MRKKRLFVKKNDYDRIVVTETLPFETPLIFSNEGFYLRLKSINGLTDISKSLIDFLVKEQQTYTIPFFYKIKKNSTESRRLAILHPSAQWKIRNFYEQNANLMIYYCSKSPASIRAPQKIAGSFYQKKAWLNLQQYKYKNSTVSTVTLDDLIQYNLSFFSYKGYNRIYKFFDSPLFFNLETKFTHYKTLDVSKCFASIYTHSLSWAVKDKEFTKANIKAKNTFPQNFDDVMQYANHRETNGIIIGPEVSRIFAEIILQKIDLNVITQLKSLDEKYIYNIDYCFKRYVDDVFIFAKSSKIAEIVYKCFSEHLNNFNLHVNTAKSIFTQRPFISSKTAIYHDISQSINEFISKFLEDSHDTTHRLIPKQIFNRWGITKAFFTSIKTLCLHNSTLYDDVSSYIIAILVGRVKKLVNVTSNDEIIDKENHYKDALLVLIESLFFFYQVSPSVNASYNIATAIILINRFTEKYIPFYKHGIKQEIYDFSETLLKNILINTENIVENFVNLESINIILALSDLGENYLLPKEIIEKVFINNKISYFHIISCIFYVKDKAIYSKILDKIKEIVHEKLLDLKDIRQNAEKTLLFLDMLSCPYIDKKDKIQLIIKFFKSIEEPEPSKESKEKFISASENEFWFVNWRENLDLLHLLEKKELKQVY